MEEEKKIREAEIKRREIERKKRHELLERDSKKSFYELNQTIGRDKVDDQSDSTTKKHEYAEEREEGELDDSAIQNASGESVDMNALDYDEDRSLDHEEKAKEPVKSIVYESSSQKGHKSDSMALALGVDIKSAVSQSKISKKDDKKDFEERNRRRSRDYNATRRNRSPRQLDNKRYRSRSNDRRYDSRRRHDRSFNNYRSPIRNRLPLNRYRNFDSRRRSRSVERSRRRNSRDKSPRRTRSRSRNRRSRSPNRKRSERRSSRSRRSTSKNSEKKEENKEELNLHLKEQFNLKLKEEHEREKLKQQKEKMLKRAEALLLLKSHMEKEIEEQTRKETEKRLRVSVNTKNIYI